MPSHGSTRVLYPWGSGDELQQKLPPVEPHYHLPGPGMPPSSCFFTGCHTWHRWHQPQCVALQMDWCHPRETAGRHQGLWHSMEALLWGGQGSLLSLSLLVAVSVLGWNSNWSLQTLRPGQPQRWAVPGAAALMGTARKVDSSDLNHTGWLPVKRHQLSHRCSHWAGHRDMPQLAQLGDTGVGRVPTQPQDGIWPPATSHTALGHSSQHL